MVVGLATTYDWNDVNRGSGTYYFFAQALRRQGHPIIKLGPVEFHSPLLSRCLRNVHRRLNKHLPVFLDPLIGKHTGRQIDEQIRISDPRPELLITNDMCIAAFVKTPLPVVLYTDMMLTYDYEERGIPTSKLANLSILGLSMVRHMFRRAMRRARNCVFHAEWSASEAIRYGIPPSKVRVIPFGANIDDPGAEPTARRLSRPPSKEKLDVLFIGKDWIHKGGDIALESIEVMRSKGIKAVLHVAGECPEHLSPLPHVKPYGFLDKRVAADRQTMDRLYTDCDILILPSKREGFGIVAVEAAAYGMPVVAYGVSGLKSAVIDGQTGSLLPQASKAKDFAACISAWLTDESNYKDFAVRARKHFESSASWVVASKRVLELIQERAMK